MVELLSDTTILNETAAEISRILGQDAERITIERVVIGLFFTGVKLSTGVAGACATPLRTISEAVEPTRRVSCPDRCSVPVQWSRARVLGSASLSLMYRPIRSAVG